MILRSSTSSPFGRKVKITAIHCGLMDKISVDAAKTMDPEDSLRTQNPLGKIPVLILDDGSALFDSRVICEYLDGLHTGAKLFPQNAQRWPALTLAALADGMMDAGILQVYEYRYRPENIIHQDWLDLQAAKAERSLTWLESTLPATLETIHIGHIGLACALGYLDFRFEGVWRPRYPALTRWLKTFEAAVPAFAETMPAD